uniref:Uncharacterized protein n=1 Tax=Gasterosteus aculeatus aculeatus TaxID=481459 RepID=A0AAQ4RLP4_GASAC
VSACSVKWARGDTEEGNTKYVNVTAAVPSTRSALHRVLVCAGVCLCLPIILCLVHGLSSEVKPQPLPRTLSIYREQQQPAPRPPPRCPVPQKPSTRSDKAVPESIQKKEVGEQPVSKKVLLVCFAFQDVSATFNVAGGVWEHFPACTGSTGSVRRARTDRRLLLPSLLTI